MEESHGKLLSQQTNKTVSEDDKQKMGGGRHNESLRMVGVLLILVVAVCPSVSPCALQIPASRDVSVVSQ